MNRARPPRPGLTLVETVVAISIVAVLAALALLAVQAARESARRATCVNNLRQLGVAIQAYAAVIDAFPPGSHGRGYSLHSMLLPYLDRRALYDGLNFQISAISARRGGQENRTAAQTSLAVFTCPSDSEASRPGADSYAGNRGRGVQKYGYDGAFPLARGPISFGDFRDGVSNTVALSEIVVGTSERSRRDPARLVFETRSVLAAPDQLEAFAAACASIDTRGAKLAPSIKGETWLVGELGFTLYNHVLPINSPSCTNHQLVQQGAWSAGSLHGAGANVLYADGHTTYVSQSVSTDVWRALGSRSGGDVSSAP